MMSMKHWWASVALLALSGGVVLASPALASQAPHQPVLSTRTIPVIDAGGLRFRDLNRNGQLDPYEDWRLTAAERADDLIGRMTMAEKAGQMLHGNAEGNAPFGQPWTGYGLDSARLKIIDRGITSLNSMLVLPPAQLAEASNSLQALAEQTRLGVPVTLSTDPRSHFQATVGASVAAGGFTRFPEPLGLAALGDAGLVRHMADVARREYRATGFSVALSPQADLATEPRWPRVNGTFGEDPDRVAPLVAAYIEGFQHGRDGVTVDGVAAVVKHWVGYGAARDGWDSHNYYGRFADLSSERLSLHLKPFEAAFAVRPAGVMPAYSIFEGLMVDGHPVEPTGAAYSRVLIHDLLREHYGYDGLVLADWAITEDCGEICRNGYPAGERPSFQGVSMAWGVEDLTRAQRFARAVGAGVDQFGGAEDPQPLLDAVAAGDIQADQMDAAVHRVLIRTFSLGLFENPFVEPTAATAAVGRDQDAREARAVQAKAMVLLENGNTLLPLDPLRTPRLFLRGVDPAAARAAGFTVVETPVEADAAVVRMSAPSEMLHPNYMFGLMQREGSLAYRADDPDLEAVESLARTLPVVVDVYLDRAAVLRPVKAAATALIVDFGASDPALFDVLTGATAPMGRLPIELPSSMDAVRAQRSDTPADSTSPLYALGFGRSY
ncbi:glycoside hydrolase family 3 N-terminal domain-containing protein [Brevundimonas sp.]|uniref:glycoside hydrolase family 3 protein n=1 Tax=Brevundimonas sp. TaxID=1871086 RepID=UPI0025C62886|nr:glycoside hydrolase family 3 N-terminal domain-containing protein [Brevundimonas sp.]